MKKQCTKCKRMLDRSEFYIDRSSNDGLCSQCKECRSKSQKERYTSLKLEAINAFGGKCAHIDKNGIQCPKNSIDNLDELHLSHPNDDGDEHRDLISRGLSGQPFYSALQKLDYNPGNFVVQVMCKAHHKGFDTGGKKHPNYGKHGRLSSYYKEGKFNNLAWLEKEYETKSMQKIAKENGVSIETIRRRMIKFNISRRKQGQCP